METRPVQFIRNLPIEQINPVECLRLLSHSDDSNAVPGRRKALWDKWFQWRQSPAGVAWDKSVVAARFRGDKAIWRPCPPCTHSKEHPAVEHRTSFNWCGRCGDWFLSKAMEAHADR